VKAEALGKRLYVGNLPFSVTEEALREAFVQYGTVTGIDVIMDLETNRPRGLGFVEFEDPAAADAAIDALDGSDFGGRNLRVNVAQERRGGGGRG
jgi:RNA recognition motif-containing protein